MLMEIVVRPAGAMDVAVPLVYATMGTFADRLFGAGNPQEATRVLQALYQRSGNRFSGEYSTAATDAGRLVGILLSYPARDMPGLDGNMAKQLLPIYGVAGFLRFVTRALPLAFVREAYAGEYFINSLAVIPEMRGQGVGTRLLACAEEKARAAGCAACALSVAIDNDGARRLYERVGYHKEATHRIGNVGFHRMVKRMG